MLVTTFYNPSIDFFSSVSSYLFYFFVLCRFLGIFIVSPLFANKTITTTYRIYLAVFSSIVISMTIYPDYKEFADQFIKNSNSINQISFYELSLGGAKEIIIGYLIGFILNFSFEALFLAGELIDNIMGFSFAQILNPLSGTLQSLSTQFFVMIGVLIMLVADFHHVLFQLLAESFSAIPINTFHLTKTITKNVSLNVFQIFIFALKLSIIPLTILIVQLTGVAFTIRLIPEINFWMNGMPIRFLIGLVSLIIAIEYIIPVFEQSFLQMNALAQQIILP